MTLRIWSVISPFLPLGSSEKILYIGTSEDTKSFVWESAFPVHSVRLKFMDPPRQTHTLLS